MKSKMSSAYASSGAIFEQVSKLHSPGLYEQLKEIGDNEIVVVNGAHDHMEKLLDTIKVPYTQINMGQVASYNGGRVMFVNCSRHSSVPVKAIRSFVEEGGRLVTTDWAVDVVNKAFPNRIKKLGSTSDDVVEIECHTDIARRFVGMNYAQMHPKWWLEGSSDVYQRQNGVVPIITSSEMEEKYGSPDVAIGFTEGKGEVIHFISHLELQRTNLRSKEDKGTLDDFLKKMDAMKTEDMEDASVAELEAAYSTLNTIANLSVKTPILNSDMKSVVVSSDVGAAKSKSLA